MDFYGTGHYVIAVLLLLWAALFAYLVFDRSE
jgi:hypothetical protein